METQKPLRLIELLRQLLAETDKINIGRIYIAIVEETARIRFAGTSTSQFPDLVYRHLVHLAIKDYIHSGRSEASAKVIWDVVGVISEAEIL